MRILVVEDQDSIRHMIEALVSARGHQVTAVDSGTKAIDIAITDPPDIVLLDMMIPGHDGVEVCQRLRADERTKDTPVVIISALTDEDSRTKAADAGATAYYTKPFSPIALLKEIEHLEQSLSAGD